ncbi:MAG: alpha/beta hydrolase [Pseudomonadota bacterium]
MLKTGIVFACLIAASAYGLGTFERQMVYPGDAKQVDPKALGLQNVTEAKFENDGAEIVLWVAPGEQNKPVILYFHGNAGNLANRAPRFDLITRQGFGLIAMSYRGYGGSDGKPSEKAILSDAAAIYTRIDSILPNAKPENTVIYGESLGTGVASRLLAEHPQAQPRAVILEAPYTSVPDVADHHMPWTKALAWQMRNRWSSKDHIKGLRAPLLIIHGDRDAVIPFEQGRQIYALAGSKYKTFLEVPGAGHNDLWRNEVIEKIWLFIEKPKP